MPCRIPRGASGAVDSERPDVVRIDRIDLEVGSESKSTFHIQEDDPLSAVAELWRPDIRAAPPDELKTKRFRS
jgi:hypothetical protein